MDIIKFTFKDEGEIPIAFPFQSMVDLMGDDGLAQYLDKFNSLKHQIEVLGAGIKYGAIQNGTPVIKTDKELFAMAEKDPQALKKVFQLYDKELTVFLRLYFSEEGEEKNNGQDKKKEGKPQVSDQ